MLSMISTTHSLGRHYKSISFPPETEPVGWIGTEDPVDNNILLYYDFENGTANDKSGNDNHGTVTGNVIQTTAAKNGSYGATGDGLKRNITTRISTDLNWVSTLGLTMSFWLKSPAVAISTNTCIVAFSSTTMLTLINSLSFRLYPRNISVTYGTDYNKWYHFFIVWTSNNNAKVYVDNVIKLDATIAYPTPPRQLQFVSTDYVSGFAALHPTSAIDDIRFFNTINMTDADRMRLMNFNSLNTGSELMLRLTLQTDATDSSGNNNHGTVYGNAIDKTRAKYGSFSLRSDGLVNSAKYVEMPAINFVYYMGMTMSFWFYNETGQSAQHTRLIEATREGNTVTAFYIKQEKSNRTKFLFNGYTNCSFYASPLDTWHKCVITITGANVVNIWIDNIIAVSNKTVNQAMSNNFDANWRIAAPNPNLNNLASFDGSIQEFKIWNRVLSNTEIIDVV